MSKVSITPLDNPKKKDSGSSYEAWPFQAEGVGIYYRQRGSISGRHYHVGTLPTNNPERGVLVQGKAVLRTRSIESNDIQSWPLEAPCTWEIFPNIYHELEALEDIIYIEPRLKGCDPDSDKVKIKKDS